MADTSTEAGTPAVAAQDLAVALSGGGHRATLFGLGALLYLADAGQGPRLGSIASISGGSLANGYLGLRCDLTTATPQDVRSHAGALAHQVARRGTLWAAPLSWAYCALVVAVLVGAGVLTWVLGPAWGWLVWAVALLIAGWLAQQRSWVARQAFERTLFSRRPLTAMHGAVDHVICATDLQTHELAYFSSRFVTSWRLGWGRPGTLTVAHAVQASAALPGAFSAVRIPVARFGFPGGHPVVRSFLLSDGGVYDNMGDQWPAGSARRGDAPGAPDPPPHRARQLVVVNASAGQGVTPRLRVRWPLFGEAATLMAVKDVLYDQTTAVRRRLLDLRFRVASSTHPLPGQELQGTLVQIDRTPFDLPDDFRRGRDPRAVRARAVLAALGDDDETRAAWAAEAEANRSVKTALSKIPAARAASLLHHAYVLTMANAHVLLDLPLLPVPDVTVFEELVA